MAVALSGCRQNAVRRRRYAITDFDLAQNEAIRLHDFLAAWFRGELDDEEIHRSFADALHPDFENVQPAGITLSKDDIVSAIQPGRGSNPDFQITVEAPRLLGTWPGHLLFQYVESQTGARSSEPENRRLATVLFERNGEKLIWRYLTEVGLAT